MMYDICCVLGNYRTKLKIQEENKEMTYLRRGTSCGAQRKKEKNRKENTVNCMQEPMEITNDQS